MDPRISPMRENKENLRGEQPSLLRLLQELEDVILNDWNARTRHQFLFLFLLVCYPWFASIWLPAPLSIFLFPLSFLKVLTPVHLPILFSTNPSYPRIEEGANEGYRQDVACGIVARICLDRSEEDSAGRREGSLNFKKNSRRESMF